MNWITVRADNNKLHDYNDFPLSERFYSLKNLDAHPWTRMDEWPIPENVMVNRYRNGVVFVYGANNLKFVHRSQVKDPFFWDQPLTMEWIAELREIMS